MVIIKDDNIHKSKAQKWKDKRTLTVVVSELNKLKTLYLVVIGIKKSDEQDNLTYKNLMSKK